MIVIQSPRIILNLSYNKIKNWNFFAFHIKQLYSSAIFITYFLAVLNFRCPNSILAIMDQCVEIILRRRLGRVNCASQSDRHRKY